MYITTEAPRHSMLALPTSQADTGSNRKEHVPLSKRELIMLSLVVLILAAGVLVPTAGYEGALQAIPVEFVLELEPRAAELAPSPPDIQLTSPVPPFLLTGGGQSRAVAM